MNNEVWKAFAAQEVTHSVAHYLTTIRELRATKGYAMLSDVAKALEVTKGSASVQVRSLKEKGLVAEVDNRFLMLTKAGEEVAAEVEFNRQILIQFFHSVLGVGREQSEIDACKIEHLLSREVRHQLFSLVQLVQSSDAAAARFAERLRQFAIHCPTRANCHVCGESCLVECDPAFAAEAREGAKAAKRRG